DPAAAPGARNGRGAPARIGRVPARSGRGVPIRGGRGPGGRRGGSACGDRLHIPIHWPTRRRVCGGRVCPVRTPGDVPSTRNAREAPAGRAGGVRGSPGRPAVLVHPGDSFHTMIRGRYGL